MKTILLAPAMFSSEGGIERMMRLYLKALCSLAGPDDDITIAVLNDRDIPPDRLAAYSSGRSIYAFTGDRRRLRFSARFLWEAQSADRVIAGHFHLSPLLDLARRLRPGLKTFVVAHGTEIWRPWSRSEQRAARRNVRFLAVSNYTRARILSRCPGLPEVCVDIVPNALDSAFSISPPQDVQRDPALILTVSRLSAADSYKGVDHLIQALPAIRRRHPDARLRIVGKGDDRERLETLADRLVPSAVEFAGFISDAEMPAEYARAGLFALPSRDEGFGLVYLEAFTQGTPCVAASSGAAPELITPATGRCAVYGDLSNLADTIDNALQVAWDHATIRQRANDYAFPTFSRRLAQALSG